jgi:hypothetical protein
METVGVTRETVYLGEGSFGGMTEAVTLGVPLMAVTLPGDAHEISPKYVCNEFPVMIGGTFHYHRRGFFIIPAKGGRDTPLRELRKRFIGDTVVN